MFPDLTPVTVSKDGPVQPIHDDGIHIRGFAVRLGTWLQRRRRVTAVQRRHDPRRVREHLRGGKRTTLGIHHAFAPSLHHEHHQRDGDQHHHHRQHQNEHLPSETAHTQQGTQTPQQPPPPSTWLATRLLVTTRPTQNIQSRRVRQPTPGLTQKAIHSLFLHTQDLLRRSRGCFAAGR